LCDSWNQSNLENEIYLQLDYSNMVKLRLIDDQDIPAVLDIYSYYVGNTIISFEYEAPKLDEFKERINGIRKTHPFLVAEDANQIVGYAYGSVHRQRTAYQWSVESTVYLDNAFHRKGIAQKLYSVLFDILRLQGFYSVYAGIGLPNEQSVGFHKAMGFTEVGIFKKVGYKMGNWHDTQWFQLALQTLQVEPVPPKLLTVPAIQDLVFEVFEKANKD
jgi:L-amino acid N-acyltransferase YncA